MESRMQWVKNLENLIILRTFSKRAALAGLHLGYGAFPLSIIEYLWRAKQPYNVSIVAEVFACATLSNPTYFETVQVALLQERETLQAIRKSSDVAAETAAALAASSIVLKNYDPSYSAKLLQTAIKDELLWGASWIYQATQNPTYLNYIQYNGRVLGAEDDNYSFSWDDKRHGTKILLSRVFWRQEYKVYRNINHTPTIIYVL